MKEEREDFRDEDIIGAVNRFKNSLISGRTKYFDVAEFEGIVEQLLEEGDLQSSEIAAKQGIRIHPNAIPLQLKYAQILISKGSYAKSLSYLKTAEQVDSTNPDVHLLKGSAQMIMGNETDALLSFRTAIKYAGADVDEILYQIGSVYGQIGNFRKAVKYLDKAVQANPKNESALYDLGFYFDQDNQLHKSIEFYNRYLDIDPFNQYVWFNLGSVYNKTENHKQAIEAFEFAYALNDKFYMALFNIGNALANAEKFNEAIEKYHEFLAHEPENDEAYCYIGECYLNTEDYSKSKNNYLKAIELNKNNDTAWFGVGLIYWIEQNFEKSIYHVKKAIKLDDENSEYWLTLGKISKDSGEKNKAIYALKNAIRREPENNEIWLTWTDTYLKFEESGNAIRILKKAIKNNADVLLKYRLIALYFELDKKEEAFELLPIALMQDYKKVEFLFDLNKELRNDKRIKKVLKEFEIYGRN